MYQWRTKARSVAYVDLIFTIIQVIAVIFLYTLAIIGSTVPKEKNGDKKEIAPVHSGDGNKTPEQVVASSMLGMGIAMLCILAVLTVVVMALRVWAIKKLFKSTRHDTEVGEILRGSRFWTYLHAVLLALSLGGFIFELAFHYEKTPLYSIISRLIYVVIEGLCIFVIRQYTKEVECNARGGMASGKQAI